MGWLSTSSVQFYLMCTADSWVVEWLDLVQLSPSLLYNTKFGLQEFLEFQFCFFLSLIFVSGFQVCFLPPVHDDDVQFPVLAGSLGLLGADCEGGI